MLPTGTMSTAVFHLPNGATAAATMIHKMRHNLREPALSVNIIPSLVGNSFLSTVKIDKAGYMAIYDDKEVNFCDTATTKNQCIGRRNPQRMAMPMGQTVMYPPD
jgi:hypothetical protein